MSRGFFAIGVYRPKFPVNVGMLLRSAHSLGAAYTFTIQKRYKANTWTTDTSKSHRHLPHLEFTSLESFRDHIPLMTEIVGVECPATDSLVDYSHPERAIYLLGSEEGGLSEEALSLCSSVIEVPSKFCLNLAMTAGIVMYDRNAK